MNLYSNQYYEELANKTGLTKFTKNGPFTTRAGTLIGEKRGYLVSVGVHKTQNKQGIGILVHFKKNENAEMIRSAVHFSHTLLSALKVKELTERYRKEFEIAEDSFFWVWPYVFKKPSPELIAETIDAFISAIQQIAPGFNGKCERCEMNSVTGISLFNGVPVYYCDSCQNIVKTEMGIAETAYEEQPSQFTLGALYGTAGALVGGIAWGYLTFYSNHIYAIAAVGIGFIISWLTAKGIGKVTVQSRILVGVLTVASVSLGDCIFIVLKVMETEQIPFSTELLYSVLSNFVEIEFRGENIPTLLFALLGAYYSTRYLARPNFKVQFERLD